MYDPSMEPFAVHPFDMDDAHRLKLMREYSRRVEKFGKKPDVSVAETVGILTEEYHEVIDAMRNNSDHRVEEELIDVACTALWGVISIRKRREQEKQRAQ